MSFNDFFGISIEGVFMLINTFAKRILLIF